LDEKLEKAAPLRGFFALLLGFFDFWRRHSDTQKSIIQALLRGLKLFLRAAKVWVRATESRRRDPKLFMCVIKLFLRDAKL